MQFKPLDQNDARKAVELLKREYPDAKYYLNFSSPVELLVAAILSAQTRDEVVNAITPELFKRFRSVDDYANAGVDDLVKYIRRVSFAGNKAKNIIQTCKMIKEKYKGTVPNRMEQLVELPGIGRKTANTILINAYNIVLGIPVDTWVIKLSYRIGLSGSKDPEEIEQDLMKIVDKKDWSRVAYVMKNHGHRICQSTVPICSKCFLTSMCPRNGVKKSL